MIRNLVLLTFIGISFYSYSQKNCSIEQYLKQETAADPHLRAILDRIDLFTEQRTSGSTTAQRNMRVPDIIKIPVVFHVLYQTPQQNISESIIQRLLAALNRDFNKTNADTVKIPAAFKAYAAAMGFEFKLATTNPKGFGTNGIVRKYTPVDYWMSDDKMKFTSEYGDDVWDTKSYLNIWICNLKDVRGYSTFPGMDETKDGIVLSVNDILYARGTTHGINDLRTIVHEAGHWLNLYHIWGEGFCGDDKVNDTPKQSTYTPGCPSGVRISCGTDPAGDMYMNFMDFTDDACMNMFTHGQRARARILFESGGARNAILSSKGLNISNVQEATAPDFYPKWTHAQVYPNPTSSTVNVYFEYDERWIGKEMQVLDMSGRIVINTTINARVQVIDVSRLNAGVYFIRAQKDGERLSTKFVKR